MGGKVTGPGRDRAQLEVGGSKRDQLAPKERPRGPEDEEGHEAAGGVEAAAAHGGWGSLGLENRGVGISEAS